MYKNCKVFWPCLYIIFNIACSIQLFIHTEDLHPFSRQYTHMTLLLTACYATFAIKQYDVAVLCILCFCFSIEWHSGMTNWMLPDGWLSRYAILYVAARPVVDHGVASLVLGSLLVAGVWVWKNELIFNILFGLIGGLLIVNHDKLYHWDVILTAIFSVSGYLFYLSEDLGLHGMWHSFMATGMAFAATAQISCKWHLLVPMEPMEPKKKEQTKEKIKYTEVQRVQF